MQPQRRVSLPAPARTTRMNGGPRLRAGTPLPPYRPSVATQDARDGREGASDPPASLGVPDTHPDRQTTPDAHATAVVHARPSAMTDANVRFTRGSFSAISADRGAADDATAPAAGGKVLPRTMARSRGQTTTGSAFWERTSKTRL